MTLPRRQRSDLVTIALQDGWQKGLHSKGLHSLAHGMAQLGHGQQSTLACCRRGCGLNCCCQQVQQAASLHIQ